MSLAKCPFCAEEIQEGALICKHCKSKLNAIKNNKELKKKISPTSYGLIILGIIFVPIIIIGTMSSIKSDEVNERIKVINEKIKTTEEYVAGKSPIKEMFVYSTNTFEKLVNPTGLDNSYSAIDYTEYIPDNGDSATVYEESTDKNKTLVKIKDNDKTIIGWINSSVLMTSDEYDNQQQKVEAENKQAKIEDIKNEISYLETELNIKKDDYKDLDLLPSEYKKLNDLYMSNGNYSLDKEAFFRKIIQQEINEINTKISTLKTSLKS